jgi:hypothetical protein
MVVGFTATCAISTYHHYSCEFESRSSVMVYNSTNINKKNTKHLILTYLTEHKKTMTYDVGNPGPGLGQAQQCGGVKTVNGIPTLPS